MKLVLYDTSYNAVKTIENIRSPVVDGNSIEWEEGSLSGINLPFLLLDDAISITGAISDGIKNLDKKEQFAKTDLVKENQELKARLETAEMAIISLMDFM
jgi:hypothetical protein